MSKWLNFMASIFQLLWDKRIPAHELPMSVCKLKSYLKLIPCFFFFSSIINWQIIIFGILEYVL